MRILAVAPWVPTSRRPRSRRLLEMLSRTHEVHLLCVAWSGAEQREAQSIRGDITVVRASKPAALLRAAASLLRGGSLQQAYASSPTLRREFVRLANELKPDAVYFNVIRSAHLVELLGARKIRRVIDLDEVRSNYYGLMIRRSKNWFWRVLAALEYRRMRAAEEAVKRDFDTVIMSSPADVKIWADSALLVRSPTEDLPASRSSAGDDGKTVLFVGRLGYRANVEAINWFLKNVWPALRLTSPGVRLMIVGENPSKSLQKFAGPDVIVTGRVESVDPYYDQASVAIVPVFMATGVQLKLIEAMSHGVASVVSPVVAVGAGVSAGVQVAQAGDDPNEWVEQIRELLSSDEKRGGLASRGRCWATEVYDSTSIEIDLLAAFDRLESDA